MISMIEVSLRRFNCFLLKKFVQASYLSRSIYSFPVLGYAAAPGQWMQAPPAPANCPPGLEYLTQIDQLLVKQQVELLEGEN